MALSAARPSNLLLMASFVSQDLMPDGMFLTPVSGLHYVLHIFDQAEFLLSLEHHDQDVKISYVQESVCQHDDRLSYLESRHSGLHARVDLKVAMDSEFRDWTENRSEEDWLTIIGLPRLGDMSSRDWQSAARRQVQELFKLTLSLHQARFEVNVLYVANPVRHRTAGKTVLNVQVQSVAVSKRLRELYSGFFRKVRPVKLPQHLRGVQVRNKVTLATRVRIRVMQELASNYLVANPGSTLNMRNYASRPTMLLTPGRDSSDRARTYNFIDAVTKLPAVFSDDSLARIFQVVGTSHPGELRSVFVVLNDNDRERCMDLAKNYRHPSRSGPRSAPTSSATASGFTSGHGSGMDLETNFIGSLRTPPPPPPDPLSLPKKSMVRSWSRSRSPTPGEDPKGRKGVKRTQLDCESSVSEKDVKKSKKSKRSRRSSTSSESSGRTRTKKSKSKKSKSRRSRSSSASSSSSRSSSASRGKKTKSRK